MICEDRRVSFKNNIVQPLRTTGPQGKLLVVLCIKISHTLNTDLFNIQDCKRKTKPNGCLSLCL